MALNVNTFPRNSVYKIASTGLPGPVFSLVTGFGRHSRRGEEIHNIMASYRSDFITLAAPFASWAALAEQCLEGWKGIETEVTSSCWLPHSLPEPPCHSRRERRERRCVYMLSFPILTCGLSCMALSGKAGLTLCTVITVGDGAFPPLAHKPALGRTQKSGDPPTPTWILAFLST